MITVIVNPVAGERRGLKLYEALQAFFSEREIQAELVKTISPGDGTHLASVALRKGHELIVAVGGDGTVNEILNGMTDQGARLGIIPAGSVNSIAKALNIPPEWQEALRVALQGNERHVDVGIAGGRAFLGTVGFGAEVEFEGRPGTSRPRSSFSHESGQALGNIHIQLDDGLELQSGLFSLCVSNLALRSTYLDPRHLPADNGLLDIELRPTSDAESTHLRTSTLSFLEPSDLALHADGEVRRASAPFVISIAKQRQRIAAPAPSPLP